jgi:flagellar L-ring protein precursor FlgH
MKKHVGVMTAAVVAAFLFAKAAAGQDTYVAPAAPVQGTPVSNADAGSETTPHLPDSVNNVRPRQESGPTVTEAPVNEVRGSLFEAAASAPVPMNAEGEPVGSAPVSFTAVSAPHPKKFKKNDLITIIVQEDSAYTSNAQSQSEKQQDFDLALQNWLQLHTSANGVPTATAVGTSGTLPEAKFKYDNNRQNQAEQDRTDSLSLRIAATVVDVKPNGSMVLEAGKDITVDREVQHFHMSGICRADDVTPDNTLLSSQLANLTVSKQTSGEVKDGVKSGWLNSIIDKVNPF